MKNLIITIDTEGDNLWNWKFGDTITTQNALFLQRFQELCNEYGYKPVWLTNYEMMNDGNYVEFISRVEESDSGELGMHLHAWNSPPAYNLRVEQQGAPYLIEYPTDIMEQKIENMTSLIKSRTGVIPTSHRAGRWAMDNRYFDILIKNGYTVDCSVTPGVSWSANIGATIGSTGTDYSSFPQTPYFVKCDAGKILEVPVTIKKTHKLFLPAELKLKSVCKGILHSVKGKQLWLRPKIGNLNEMVELVDIIEKSSFNDYIMFMIHSSELMPGGSPTFRTKEDIDNLYKDLNVIFTRMSKNFAGVTLRDYYNHYQNEK